MDEITRPPRVVLVGLASCFGCQINITNIEQYLLDVLGQIDMQYWQLTSSDEMPKDFDVAVIEGAVTTNKAADVVRALRDEADCVITIGACSQTAGIPGIASHSYAGRVSDVYGNAVPSIVSDDAIKPVSVKSLIDVDFEVSCCPIDPMDFVSTLQHALYGSNIYERTSTLCGECKGNERGCFYGRETLCMGLVTRSGCGARCPNLGRPCNGCAGLSPDANIEQARKIAQVSNVSVDAFDSAIRIFNQVALDESLAQSESQS